MNTSGRISLGGAAIVAAIVVIACSSAEAVTSPPGTGSVASQASTGSPLPSPTSPPASPTPRALPNDAPVAAGSYVLAADNPNGVAPLRIAFDVPSDGWDSWGPGVSKDGGGLVGIGFLAVANLYKDPCHRNRGRLDPAVGRSVADLAAALASQPGIRSTTPTKVSLGGYSGSYVELTVDPSVAFADCDDDFFSAGWITTGGDSVPVLDPGQVSGFWILDVAGTRLVVTTFRQPAASENDRVELQWLLDSIRIEP